MKQGSFRNKLLQWHSVNKRNLPWKKTHDPYKIWVSEIILQQTRVEQGKPYYHRMIRHFPTVKALAAAHEDQVLRAWQGLGYYSRARNLHAAAKQIMRDRNGKFPSTYEEILNLKGVGQYTAAAIASFAFDLPYAVVDGNVYRVLARFFGIKEDISSSAGKKRFNELAEKILDRQKPAEFNQAIMDFGSLICKPANPNCHSCFAKNECYAYRHNKIDQLPINNKKQNIRPRYFTFLVFKEGNNTIIEKRMGNDIWKGLYQFPMIESPSPLTREELLRELSGRRIFRRKNVKIDKESEMITHTLSHQKIFAKFFEFDIRFSSLAGNPTLVRIKRSQMNNYSFPKIISDYIKK